MPKHNGCQARQYSDQMYCPKCRITWDVNDPDPPECRDEKRARERRQREALARRFKDKKPAPFLADDYGAPALNEKS